VSGKCFNWYVMLVHVKDGDLFTDMQRKEIAELLESRSNTSTSGLHCADYMLNTDFQDGFNQEIKKKSMMAVWKYEGSFTCTTTRLQLKPLSNSTCIVKNVTC
jgi:hypothetical protein